MALQPIGDLNWKRSFTDGFAAFGALADFRVDQGGFLLTHDFSRNPNVPWGMVRQGRINCKKRTKFGFGIQVSASQSGSANIYLRLWAGPSRYLDASATVPCGTQNQLYVDVKNWKYRCTRGAGMGKSILPYSGASIGDSVYGVDARLKENNPFNNVNANDVNTGSAVFSQAMKDVQSAMERARRLQE